MVSKNSKIFYPIFRYSSLVLFLAISAQADEISTVNNLTKIFDDINNMEKLLMDETSKSTPPHPTIIYFGDSDVKIGEPFFITCFISISEPVQWFKDGLLIDQNDLDYIQTEEFVEVSLNAIYDMPENQIKIFNIWEPLNLVCNMTPPAKLDLIWFKDGVPISQAIPDRSRVIQAEHRLVVEKTKETDAGKYECLLKTETGNETAVINVIANVVAHLPKSVPVVEEEKLTITCVARGTDPEFSWRIGNKTFTESEDRVILGKDEAGRKNAVLSYEKATLDDRGNFTCEVRNIATNFTNKPATATTFVRVKGKLAALWPFLGICAEVFVLCAIILIYEKRRNKQEAEESDTDSPELKNDQPGKDSDVRHRK